MNATVEEARSSMWARRLRNGAVLAAVLVALYALLGFLALPWLVKPRLEVEATRQLERRATLGKLEFNPFTFRARLTDFALADRDPQRAFVRFDTLDVDVSTASLWHRAPVFDAVRLVHPRIDVTRNVDGTYSIDDLIARVGSRPEGATSLFSINNIEVDDGTFALDDRPHRRSIAVSSIGIGIPFLSSLPYDAQIRVTPRFDGAIDGSRFALRGDSTSPFVDRREAILEWNLDALPLARYAEYWSLPGGVRLADGALTSRLKLTFVVEKDVARTIVLSGMARVDKLALVRKDGTRLAGLKSIDVGLAKLDWLQRAIALDRVIVDGLEGDVRRDADGTAEFARIVAAEPAPKAQTPARPWTFSISDARISNGTFRVADRSVSPAFEAVLQNVGVEATKIASTGTPGTLNVRFDVDDGAHLDLQSEIDVAAQAARGHFSLKTFHLAKLYPYYAPALNLEVRRGTLDMAGEFRAEQGAATRLSLSEGTATLANLETAIRGERDPLWRVANGALEGVAFDLAGRTVTIERARLEQGSVRVVREADGALNFERLVRNPQTPDPNARRADKAAPSDSGWTYVVRRADLARIAADFEDRAAGTPVKVRISDARVKAEQFGNARGVKSTIEAAVRIGQKGRLGINGTLVIDPPAADCRIDAAAIDLVPLRPYFESRTNVVVTGGNLAAKGRVTFTTAREGAPRIGYKGDVTIGDFGSLDRPTSQELMSWKTLALTGIETTTEPLNLAIGAVAMDRFYARVILNDDATLNLAKLLAPEATEAKAASTPPSTTTAGVTTKELAPREPNAGLPVAIGRIQLSSGEVQYSDFFVKPNYTAHITDVNGSVSALSAAQTGTVELAGRVEGTSPVDLRGTLNPFAQTLELDLTGKASDIDLPPLTPYSVKYAGYGIQKGKLSLEVHYKVDDRKLAATNKLKLDQLTFGEHVESPTATKLPVLLAVSLLKDRNGVINLDLPIQGTLDDPQFSVWGVLVQIFVNLITKAVTAPFALLSSLAGGGGEQLAYVEFPPGRAELSAAAQSKLQTLAKALQDRPGLKIDAVGRAIPDTDRDGLQHAMLERALRVQKQKALAGSGESAPSLEALTIDAAEYPKLLTAVYRDTDLPDKPRNAIGIAKSIPPAEMEALLLKSYRVDDQALVALANRRAQTVKEWLAASGGLAPERLFIVAPKMNGDGITDNGPLTRVDFAIR